jgi:hypothetical protein
MTRAVEPVADPVADLLLDELAAAAGRRRRLLAVECDDSLLEAVPQMQSDPGRRHRLLELLTELRDRGSIEWSVARDRSVRPELPSFITLVPAAAAARGTSDLAKVAWRPELEWAYGLRLTPPEHETLTVLNAYRRDRDHDAEVIPHRERSLLLFGDEKRIDRLVRSRLFEHGRLSLDILDCYWAGPPIAWTPIGAGSICVVSENAASWHTLRRVLTGKVAAVAYGAGSAFVQSVADLASTGFSRLAYIGDLDAEGVAIPQRAAVTAERFNLPAPDPYSELWQLLVDLAAEHGQPANPVPTEVAAELAAWFGATELAKDVQRLLEAGVRVPQEALTADRLGSRVRGGRASASLRP